MNDRLIVIRQTLQKTQIEMANDLSVKQSFYSDLENKRRNVSTKFVQKLKDVLKISPDWMFTGKGDIFTPEGSYLYTKVVPHYVPTEENKLFEDYKNKNVSELSVGLIDGLIRNSIQLLNFYCSNMLGKLTRGYKNESKNFKSLHKYIADLDIYVDALRARSPLRPPEFENYTVDEKILLLNQLNLRIGECLDIIWLFMGDIINRPTDKNSDSSDN